MRTCPLHPRQLCEANNLLDLMGKPKRLRDHVHYIWFWFCYNAIYEEKKNENSTDKVKIRRLRQVGKQRVNQRFSQVFLARGGAVPPTVAHSRTEAVSLVLR